MELKFERGLWRETLRNCRINLTFILVIVGVLLPLSIAEEIWDLGNGSAIGTTIAWILLAIAAHATILKGKGGYQAAADKQVFISFSLRTIGFALVGLVGSLFTLPFVGDGGLDRILLLMVPVYGLVEALILSKWGTWLPAVLADGDRSFAASGKRGNITFGYVCLRLVTCNGLLLAVAFLGFGLGIALIGSDGSVWSAANGLSLSTFLLLCVFYFVFAIQTVLLATILSRAYLIAEAKLNNKMPATTAGISEVTNASA
jgi:hypothetical protein